MVNRFSPFDLGTAFSIDVAILEQRYEQLMTVCHPDRFAAAPAFEQRAAAKRAADINEAFNVLKKPVSRAGHLLQLAGVDLPALERQPAAPEFLFGQIMLREKVQEFGDLNPDDAAELTSEIEDGYVSTQAKFATHYEAGDIAAASAAWVEFHFQQKLSDGLARARS